MTFSKTRALVRKKLMLMPLREKKKSLRSTKKIFFRLSSISMLKR